MCRVDIAVVHGEVARWYGPPKNNARINKIQKWL